MQYIIEALGWALIHFTWQGAVIGVGLAVVLQAMKQSSASSRYAVSVSALLALAMSPIVTFFMVYEPGIAAISTDAVSMDAGATAIAMASAAGPGYGMIDAPAIWSRVVSEFSNFLPVIVALWLAGVVVIGGRLVRDWLHVRRLMTHGIQPLPIEWQLIVQRLADSLGVRQAVRVFESTLVTVPMVIGWLKPVVLIPPSAIMGLTPKQLELILAHELAHVRRFDYLVNLIQLFIETLLFYHPMVRWVSTRIREERENCCDDMVVSLTGERIIYAQALTEMAELHNLTPQVTVAASGGALFKRIHRLISLPAPQKGSVHWMVGLVLVATSMALVTTGQLQLDSDSQPADITTSNETMAPEAIVNETIANETTSIATDLVSDSVAANTSGAVDAEPVADNNAADVDVQSTPIMQPAIEAEQQPSVDESTSATAQAQPKTSQAIDDVIESLDRVDVNATDTAQAATIPSTDNESIEDLAVDTVQSDTQAAPDNAQLVAKVVEQVARQDLAPVGGRLISGKQPVFPGKARMRGVQGWVTIRYTVNTDGKVEDFDVIGAEPRRVFEKSVRRAVRTWKFEPFLIDGQPVAKTVEQTIEFALGGSRPAASAAKACVYETGSRLCREAQNSVQLGQDVIHQAALSKESSQ